MEQSEMIRPTWDYGDFHRNEWIKKDITVIMCERDTADVTKLCLESLLRFYPDIPILIIDGGSIDESLNYVHYLAATYPNIRLWERGGRNGHGTMLDEGIRHFIKTRYVLLCDNDIIIKRGGWIEQMLWAIKASEEGLNPIYTIGTLMLVSDSGDGCSPPKDDNDILRYTHPSCSMINRDLYLPMRPFVEHGAPLVYNMQDAKQRGYRVENFPIHYYVAHLSGASWTEPRTIWKDDMDVLIRPFFTFIADNVNFCGDLHRQSNKDYEVLFTGESEKASVVIHNLSYYTVDNKLYPFRFRVHGEYICHLFSNIEEMPTNFIKIAKKTVIHQLFPEEITIGGFKFVKRKLWQHREALL
jgi:glycosyltransferase involved in cell wall biosynthesis